MVKFLPSIKWLILGVSVTLLVVACHGKDIKTSKTNSVDCRTVRHDVGQSEICDRAEKIVALRPYCLDLLLSLNRQPAGYGEVFSIHNGARFNQPREQIPYLGTRVTTNPVNLGTGDEPSLEKLVQLKPDLIIGESGGTENIYPILSDIAPTLLWEQRTKQGKWKKDIRQLAKALGEEKQAESAIAQYESKLANARQALASVVETHPQVLLLAANRLAEGFFVINHNTFLSHLFKELGFILVTPANSEPDALSFPMSLETLPEVGKQADLIFVLGYDLSPKTESLDQILNEQTSVLKKEWQDNPITQSLNATQENRVYFTTYYLWNGLNGPIGAQLILEELRQMLSNFPKTP
jgi:iron complex transport system substrate-binding protein